MYQSSLGDCVIMIVNVDPSQIEKLRQQVLGSVLSVQESRPTFQVITIEERRIRRYNDNVTTVVMARAERGNVF